MLSEKDQKMADDVGQPLPLIYLTDGNPEDPILGTESTEEDIYIFYRRKIQVYGVDFKMNAEMILSDTLKSHSLSDGHLLLLYENKMLQRRAIDDWQSVFVISHNTEAISVTGQQRRVILKTPNELRVLLMATDHSVETVGEITLGHYSLKSSCFSFVNHGTVINCGCLLFRDNTIRKYSINRAGFECQSEIASTGRLIIQIFIVRFASKQPLSYQPEYILTVDGMLRLDLYELFAGNQTSVLTCRPEGCSTQLAIVKILFDHTNNRLWLQKGQTGLTCVRFRRQISIVAANGQDKFIEEGCRYELGEQLLALASGGLVVRDKKGLGLLKFQQNKVKQKKETITTKTKQQLLQQKEQIRQEIISYGRKNLTEQKRICNDKVREMDSQLAIPEQHARSADQDYVGLDEYQDLSSYLQVFSRLPEVGELLKQFDVESHQQKSKLKQDINQLKQQNSQLSRQLEIVIGERNEMFEKLIAIHSDAKVEYGSQTNIVQKKDLQTQTTAAFNKAQVRHQESSTIYSTSQSEVQTEFSYTSQQELLEICIKDPEFRQLLCNRLDLVEERVLKELTARYVQLEQRFSQIKSELFRDLSEKMERVAVRETNQCLNEHLLSRVEKYFRLTFDKVTDAFEKSLKHFEAQTAKETCKLSEVSRELIDKNRAIIEKIVGLFKQSILKFNTQGQETIKSLNGKLQDIKIVDEKAGNALKIISTEVETSESAFAKLFKCIDNIGEQIININETKNQKQKLNETNLISAPIPQQQSMWQPYMMPPQQPTYYPQYPQYSQHMPMPMNPYPSPQIYGYYQPPPSISGPQVQPIPMPIPMHAPQQHQQMQQQPPAVSKQQLSEPMMKLLQAYAKKKYTQLKKKQ